jgi:hypothetical protein
MRDRMEIEKTIIGIVLRKSNPKAFAMVLSMGLAFAGAIMIFNGVKDDGIIDVKAAFVTGQFRTGMVGVTLVFVSFLICLATLYYRGKDRHPDGNRQTVKYRRGDSEIEWTGPLSYWAEAQHVESLLKNVATAMNGINVDSGTRNLQQAPRKHAPSNPPIANKADVSAGSSPSAHADAA